MIKIIAIGNSLMKDDGIANHVLKEINIDILKLKNDVEIIYGETDFIYCLNKILDNDIVIIIDGCMLGKKPGTVTLTNNIEYQEKNYSSQHQLSLPQMLSIQKDNVKVYIIGIEIYDIDYGTKLSNVLSKRFNKICQDVYNQIEKIIEKESINNA